MAENYGEYNYMIDIMKITTGQNEMLSDYSTLRKICSVHASVNSPTRKDNEMAAADNQELDIIFKIRYSKRLKNILVRKQDFRVMFDGVVFSIKYTDNFKYKNETIRLSCKAVTRYAKKENEH